MPLGKTLASLRKSASMTQGELGEKLNISAQAISKWENGTSEPDIATLKKIADIYGITVAEIIDPDNAPMHSKMEPSESEKKTEEVTTFDVYLTSSNPERKITAIAYLRNLTGLGLAEAKNAVENPPYLITGNACSEEYEKIRAYFGEIGAAVTSNPASGKNEPRALNFVKPEPKKPKKEAIGKY